MFYVEGTVQFSALVCLFPLCLRPSVLGRAVAGRLSSFVAAFALCFSSVGRALLGISRLFMLGPAIVILTDRTERVSVYIYVFCMYDSVIHFGLKWQVRSVRPFYICPDHSTPNRSIDCLHLAKASHDFSL